VSAPSINYFRGRTSVSFDLCAFINVAFVSVSVMHAQ
jgi:hypothetical protein